MYTFRFDVVFASLPFLLDGIRLTLVVTGVALSMGVVIGLITAVIRLARIPILNPIVAGYVEFFRGTPALVQIMWFFFGLPIILGVQISAGVSGTVALGLNAGAFLSEVFRAGIQAIPPGHIDAGLSLAMSRLMVFRRIILPQAIVIVLPALGNIFISLIKDSSLVSVIAVDELMHRGDDLNTRTYRPIEVYTVVAFIYFTMTYTIAQIMNAWEKRLRRRRKKVQ
jgi:polar amino acid transport system permease protein